MAICQATKHSFLMTQALVTCRRRLAGENTCGLVEIYHAHSNLCVSM